MNVNWLKVGKVVSATLPLIAGAIGAVVSTKENKQTTIETTEKLFKEYVENENK